VAIVTAWLTSALNLVYLRVLPLDVVPLFERGSPRDAARCGGSGGAGSAIPRRPGDGVVGGEG